VAPPTADPAVAAVAAPLITAVPPATPQPVPAIAGAARTDAAPPVATMAVTAATVAATIFWKLTSVKLISSICSLIFAYSELIFVFIESQFNLLKLSEK
jgi:hypothetical protein